MIESKDLPYNPKFSDNIHNTYITLFVFMLKGYYDDRGENGPQNEKKNPRK